MTTNHAAAARNNLSVRNRTLLVLGALALGLAFGAWLWSATLGRLGAEHIAWSRSLFTAQHVLGPFLTGSFVGILLIQRPKRPFWPLVLTLTFLPQQVWYLQTHPALLAAVPLLLLGVWIAAAYDRPRFATGFVALLAILSAVMKFNHAPFLQ